MNNIKRFIAQQGSATTVKVFLAETGQLYRVIDVGTIVSTPVCTEAEMTVSVKGPDGKTCIKIYSVPGFNIKQSISL